MCGHNHPFGAVSIKGQNLSSAPHRLSGFTLLEMSIVLLIMGLLLGSVMRPMGGAIKERQRSETQMLLVEIREAIIGFASIHRRLPCPVSAATAGTRQGNAQCVIEHGYVPAAVLGVSGQYNDDGLLVDSWGQPIGYHVSLSDANGNGLPDFTTTDEMRQVGMQNLTPGYEVCDATNCSQLRANNLPAVLVSDAGTAHTSADEIENRDGDTRFVSRDLDLAGQDQFDDIVIWLSGNILYTRLLQAQVLP